MRKTSLVILCIALCMILPARAVTLAVPVLAEENEKPTVDFTDFNNGTTMTVIDYPNGTIDTIIETLLRKTEMPQLGKSTIDLSGSISMPTSSEEFTDYSMVTQDAALRARAEE